MNKENKNLTFVDLDVPVVVDTFLDQVISNVCIVMWKGEPFLRLCTVYNNSKEAPTATSGFDDDDDDDEDESLSQTKEEKVLTKYSVYCDWPEWKYYQGECATLAECKVRAHAAANELEAFLRRKFFMKAKT